MNAFKGLCRSVILASIASGGAQAAIAGLVCLFLGMKQFAVIFLVVFIASFLPLVGSFPIMAFLTIEQFLGDTLTNALKN